MKTNATYHFQGKVALVTGASSGIGEATAIAFSKNGAAVTLADWDAEKGQALAKKINDLGGKSFFVKTDVSSESDVQKMVAQTMEKFGRLDFAFNNAGISGGLGNAAEVTAETWNKVIAVNLTGTFLCMKYEILAMQKSKDTKGGAIVNNSSILGNVAFPGAVAYTASKHGVLGLTKTAAAEYATQNIRINAVCPGFILTPMLTGAGIAPDNDFGKAIMAKHPMNRMGTPDEIAAATLWLCSDESSFVTGHPLLVDGGYVSV